MLLFFVFFCWLLIYIYIGGSGSIISVEEERADLSTIVYL